MEICDAAELRRRFPEQLEELGADDPGGERESGDVATWPREALDEPEPTGSPVMETTGTVRVTRWKAWVVMVPVARRMSTLSPISSTARRSSRSAWPSADRNSMTKSRPSS